MDIKLPELGEGIESGDVISVLVNEGDTVEKEQGLIELETDKASVEIPSSHAGKVTKIHVKEGDTLNVGGVIVSLETESSDKSSHDDGDQPEAEEAEASDERQTADVGVDDDEPADETAESQGKPAQEEKEGEDADADADADADGAGAGNGKQTAGPKPQPQPPSEPTPEPSPKPQPRPEPEPEPPPGPQEQPTQAASPSQGAPSLRVDSGVIPAGPAMRRFAREVGVDLARVEGTGPGGRITRGDILRIVREGSQRSQQTATQTAEPEVQSQPAPAPAPSEEQQPAAEAMSDRDSWGPVKVEKLPKIRRTIAAKMHESWTTIPRVTNFDDADVTELEQIRKSSKDDYAAAGIKLTALPFVIKACAMSLKSNPVVNASIDMEKGEVVYKQYVNVGIAVDTERGLIVPSLRNADQLSIPDIARELADLAEKVRDGSFTIDELRGSTFTISNLGAIGGTYSTPIINPPEVAVLLVGRARKSPVVADHKFAVRLMMPLSLSYDHRLVDGAAAARFLNEVKDYLQSPSRLLLAP